mgnify:CR=1 FL=1
MLEFSNMIENMNGKSLNIYLLNKCEPSGKCLAVGNKSSESDDVIIKNLAAGIYYIWVDGFLETNHKLVTIVKF